MLNRLCHAAWTRHLVPVLLALFFAVGLLTFTSMSAVPQASAHTVMSVNCMPNNACCQMCRQMKQGSKNTCAQMKQCVQMCRHMEKDDRKSCAQKCRHMEKDEYQACQRMCHQMASAA